LTRLLLLFLEKKKPHIKKPLNAFMLYMKEMRAKVVAECTLKESAAINQILGRRVRGVPTLGTPLNSGGSGLAAFPRHIFTFFALTLNVVYAKHLFRRLCPTHRALQNRLVLANASGLDAVVQGRLEGVRSRTLAGGRSGETACWII